MVQTGLLYLSSSRNSHIGIYKKKMPPLADQISAAGTTEKQIEEPQTQTKPESIQRTGEEMMEQTTKRDLSTDTPGPATAKRAAPKFPSPSECSKWLMLFWFAGFPIQKIHWLLSQYFKLEGHKAYTVENIESSFRKLQKNANRNNPDYYAEPYMYYIMTSKSSSPFEFRQSATRWIEKHHLAKADEMTEDDEIKEMAAWYLRWCEEVQLMEKSKVKQYLEKAETFATKLDYYAVHFDPKGHIKYFEDEASLPPSKHSKHTPANTDARPASRNNDNMRNWGDDVPVRNIDRPKLTVRTKVEALFSRAKHEGTPTPSSAQHLDDLGFFAPRPRKSSPSSIVETRTRTPSIASSTENSNASKTSLQVSIEAQRRPSA